MDKSLPQQLQQEVSGSFRKTALLQKRVRELIRGARPMIEVKEGMSPIEVAFREMQEGMIELVTDEDTPTL